MVNVHKQDNRVHYVKRDCACTVEYSSLVRAAGTLRTFHCPT
ncbi:Hypothetical protein Y17_3954 [Pectobacterium wasabiae CFBP 3304]|nr:Hypothetical protein Y17_3954 [Pectobacterium wasabiae CFBP 3304]